MIQRKFANLGDIPSALSLPSEEQYSKCTYPLCFERPFTQLFTIFVYTDHHFRRNPQQNDALEAFSCCVDVYVRVSNICEAKKLLLVLETVTKDYLR